MRHTKDIDTPTMQDIIDRDRKIEDLTLVIKNDHEEIIKMLERLIPGRGVIDDAVYMIKSGLYRKNK